MDPGISANMRKSFTELDFAALQDIGYTVDAIPEPSVAAMMGLGLLGLSIPAILRRRAKAGPHCH